MIALLDDLFSDQVRSSIRLRAVHLAGIPAVHALVVNPVDDKSMNRWYPGKMDGTQTDRASYLITKQVVEQCDHLIDLHGGDLEESLRPYSYWTKTGNET